MPTDRRLYELAAKAADVLASVNPETLRRNASTEHGPRTGVNARALAALASTVDEMFPGVVAGLRQGDGGSL